MNIIAMHESSSEIYIQVTHALNIWGGLNKNIGLHAIVQIIHIKTEWRIYASLR